MKDIVFTPEVLCSMGKAFDMACQKLRCQNKNDIAQSIVDAAAKGQTDPISLCTSAVASFNRKAFIIHSNDWANWVEHTKKQLAAR